MINLLSTDERKCLTMTNHQITFAIDESKSIDRFWKLYLSYKNFLV